MVKKISLLSAPITTLSTLVLVLLELLQTALGYVVQHFLVIFVLVGAAVAAHTVEGVHSDYVLQIDQLCYYAGYWIFLGILSSVGLGTGLHTFVIYLAPFIAKTVMISTACGAVPQHLPSRYTFQKFGACPEIEEGTQVNFSDLFWAVQLESFLWGFGTAIGELPPYLVARAASLAGKKDKELEELENEGGDGLFKSAKQLLQKLLKEHGFVTVLACASIPNPLFDLAGLTCGHFLIPFWTFFIATAIGKSIFKVHFQIAMVIIIFSGTTMDYIVSVLNQVMPSVGAFVAVQMSKQRQKLHSTNQDVEEGPKHIMMQIWDGLISLMVLYFVISIIDSLVDDYRVNYFFGRVLIFSIF